MLFVEVWLIKQQTDLEYVMPEDTALEAEQDGHDGIFQKLILEDWPHWAMQMCNLLIYEKHGRYFVFCLCNGSRFKSTKGSQEQISTPVWWYHKSNRQVSVHLNYSSPKEMTFYNNRIETDCFKICGVISVSSQHIALCLMWGREINGDNWPSVCRPAPEKASGSEQTVHNMMMSDLSEERSTLH